MDGRAAAPLRLEVYHASQPKRRVLVSVPPTATIEALHDAIAVRLDVRPERCCLGETEAQVLAVGDLREGDVLRVVLPDLPPEEGAETPDGGSSDWRGTVRLLLTLVIFVALFEAFQRWVFLPSFRPDLLRGERVLVNDE